MRVGDPRPAGLAFRRAVRRFVGDSDVVRVGDGATARHGGAVGRRRRRAVRRLRPLRAASARRRLRSLQPARVPARRGDRRGRLPHGVRGKNFLRHVGRDEQGRYLDAIRFFGADEKPDAADARRAAARSPDRIPRRGSPAISSGFAHLPWASQMMRFDAETYLPEDVLTKVDRMSMAHSIESRVPLLDNEVIAFASALPASLKIKDGRRKHVLKEVAATLLPPRDPRPRASRASASRWAPGFAATCASCSPTRCCRRERCSAATSSRPSSAGWSAEHLAGQARPHPAAVAAGRLRALESRVRRSARFCGAANC